MNLLTHPWLPVRLRDGGQAHICVRDIVRPDVIALDFPRLDFNGAVAEFLVALLSTVYAPQDEKAWRRLWKDRPSAEALQAAFQDVLPAFDVDVFMQRNVAGTRVGKPNDKNQTAEERTADRLLIDNLSGTTAKAGRDLLNRAERIPALGLPSAVAALITLQMHANQGGRAAYQCARGGGCMTTLIVDGDDLWGLIWPNVETEAQVRGRAVGKIPDDRFAPFPWMWDMPEDLTPDNAHPCVIYWATPRRIKLNISKTNESCCLSGAPRGDSVRSFEYLAGGPRFVGWQRHPLSASEGKKKGDLVVASALTCPPDRIGMQHWLGLVHASDGAVSPATCVAHARLNRRVSKSARLVVHGYAAKAATVLAWQSAEMPLVLAEDDEVNRRLMDVARMLVGVTQRAARAVEMAVQQAQGLKSAKDTRKNYIRHLSKTAGGRIWRDLEREFFAALAAIPDALPERGDDPTRSIRTAFYVSLRRAAYRIVNETCPDDGLAPRDVVTAHLQLRKTLQNKGIATMLGLPVARPT